MKDEIKEYPKEQQKLKDYLDNVTIEQIIDKLKDDDGMTWWVDYQDQYQPNWKKLYVKEVQLLLDYITNLQEENQTLKNQLDFIEEQNHIIDKLEKENERLKLVRDTKCASEILCECLNNVYKSRCEKARKMIKFIAYNNERTLTITELNKVYNILGGDDNE